MQNVHFFKQIYENLIFFCPFLELDVCIYLMSAVGIKMEVEDGASATASELVRKFS